jgi:hemerythrin
METVNVNASMQRTEKLEHSRRWLQTGLGIGVLILGSAGLLGAQQAPAAQPAEKAVPSIHQLFEEDQKDRTTPNIDWDKVSAHDKEHRRLSHRILEAGALQTAQDFQDAAFIFQHGETPQDYMLGHILAMAATSKGSSLGRWIAAATLDRYLQMVSQPQVFGTQYVTKDPKAQPLVTWQEPYDKDLISDALRQEFCVSTYAHQQENVVAMNQNKDMPYGDTCRKAAPASPAAGASPIHPLFEEDQKDRATANADWDKVSAHDTEHRKLVHQMLEAGALKTGQDFEDASFIFQHGDKPEDYLLAHILALAAMEKGDAKARWIAAATLDRYLQSVKQPQVFGTQYRWDHEGPSPSKDATQQPYDTGLLSDAIRKEFCVTTYAGQQSNLEALNHGKDFPSPDSCPK